MQERVGWEEENQVGYSVKTEEKVRDFVTLALVMSYWKR